MKALRFIIPIVIVSVALLIAYLLITTRPEPPRFAGHAVVPEVEVIPMEKEDYAVMLRSQGTVQARTQSSLVAEVRGRLIEIDPTFRDGGFFEKGDLLARIDPSDYETEVVVAEAALAQAELTLAEEVARAEQALVDWERLEQPGEPSDLVLRVPQKKEAEALVASAQARLEKARLDLERTRITAPYAGRVLEKNVDVGQYVGAGTVLARVYAVDYAEIRLPLNETQLSMVNLPELYRGESLDKLSEGPRVLISTRIGENDYQWEARVVRAEGSFDTTTRQLFVIAQVEDPYARHEDGRPPLKVGSFVEAKIEGKLLKDVHPIPRKLYRESSYVLTVSPDKTLHRRLVTPLWSDQENILVREGIPEEDRLCITPLRYAVEGSPVEIVGEESEKSGGESGQWASQGGKKG